VWADSTSAQKALEVGDYATALREFRLLAEQGHAEAQSHLGGMYALGQGVPQNHTEAAQWFHKAAAQGHAGAQAVLGHLYLKGQGVQQDYTEAARWSRKAAEQGQYKAQQALVLASSQEVGLPQNYLGKIQSRMGILSSEELLYRAVRTRKKSLTKIPEDLHDCAFIDEDTIIFLYESRSKDPKALQNILHFFCI
jgi:TPR repeat protein